MKEVTINKIYIYISNNLHRPTFFTNACERSVKEVKQGARSAGLFHLIVESEAPRDRDNAGRLQLGQSDANRLEQSQLPPTPHGASNRTTFSIAVNAGPHTPFGGELNISASSRWLTDAADSSPPTRANSPTTAVQRQEFQHRQTAVP